MKRAVACFLLCVYFSFSWLSLSSSAVDGTDSELELFEYNENSTELEQGSDDLIAEGWSYDSSDGSYFINEELGDWIYDMPEVFSLSSPIYPSFDPSMIPWDEAPDYITDILALPIQQAPNVAETKMPFVYVCYRSARLRVVVGVNLALALRQNSSGAFNYACIVARQTASFYSNAVCYMADFDPITYDIIGSWEKQEPTTWSSDTQGNFVRFTSISFSGTSTSTFAGDFYLYGSNFVKDNVTSVYYPLNDAGTTKLLTEQNYSIGFASSTGFANLKAYLANSYITSFTPPTREQQAAQTQRNIFESIKSIWLSLLQLPTNIANSIKGFFENLLNGIKNIFIPSEDYFNAYQEELQIFFKARLGVIYEIGDVVVSLLEKLITYNPKDSDYIIEFPAVPAPSFNPNTQEIEWHSLIPATTFSFSEIVSEGVFKTLYSAYISMVKLLLVFMAIKLFSRKANEVFGERSVDS